MAPSVDAAAHPSAGQVKSENAGSVKVLEELLQKLTVSKAQEDILSTSHDLATFINGDIEEGDAPTQ